MLSDRELELLQRKETPIVKDGNIEIGPNWIGITFDSANSFSEAGFVGFKDKKVPELKEVDINNLKKGPHIFNIHEEISITNDLMGVMFCHETISPIYFYSAIWEPGYRGKGQLLGLVPPIPIPKEYLRARIILELLTKPTESYKGSYKGERMEGKTSLEESSELGRGGVLSKKDIEKLIRDGVVTDFLDLNIQLQPCGLDLTVKKIFDINKKEIKLQEGKRTFLEKGVYPFETNEKCNQSPYFLEVMYSRSSLCRSGACIAHAPLVEGDSLFGNQIKNVLSVYNSHGLEIEKNSRVGQLVFRKYVTPSKILSRTLA